MLKEEVIISGPRTQKQHEVSGELKGPIHTFNAERDKIDETPGKGM